MITPSFTVLFSLKIYVMNYSLRSMYFQRKMLREQNCKQMDTPGTLLRLPACLLNHLTSLPGKGATVYKLIIIIIIIRFLGEMLMLQGG